MTPPVPANEEERLAKLRQYAVLDTEPEKAFDDITWLAAHLCSAPVALVSLVDENRQWFKSCVGISVHEMPREIAFCAHAILTPELMQVSDTTLDPRFCDNPLVTGEPHVRFYAGAPLVTPDGHALGTLCVVDLAPRALTDEQARALENLSRVVVAQLELRRAAEEQRESQRELQAVTDNVPLLISRISRDRRYLFANKAYEDYIGIPKYEIIGNTMTEVIGAQACEALEPYVERVLRGECVVFDPVIVTPRLGARLLHISYVPERDREGQVTSWVISALDVTEQRAGERERQRLADNVRLLLDSSGEGVFGIDLEGRCTFMNAAAARMFQCKPEDVLGWDMHLLIHHSHEEGCPYPVSDCPIHRALRTGQECRVDYEVLWRSDGISFPAHYSAAPLREDGAVCGCVVTCVDITDRKALEAERERLLDEAERLLADAVERADRDPLTGLLNHRAFHKRLHEEADRAQREGQPLAVAMLDLDNFKFFNDVYGHPAGDEVLRRVAEGLRESCRSYDVIARFGGDEFAILMPGLKEQDAEGMTRRFLQAMSERGFLPPGHDTPIPLSLSAGIAIFPDDAPARLQALELADARLRLAKTGADEVVVAAQRVRRAAATKFSGFPMLDALVAAVDNKDRYTRRHSEEVLAYSLEIARELEWDASAQHTLSVAALLHDVGKIGVPDHILRKPGRLTSEEYEAMQQHPMMGAVMVAAVPGFEATLDAIRHHHERWDGCGYPFGQVAHEIPLMARVLAVADSYSAMTTDRPYRKGMTQDRALAIIQSGAGRQWDPDCVAAFLRAKARQCDSCALGEELGVE